jgi:hypothetical protein
MRRSAVFILLLLALTAHATRAGTAKQARYNEVYRAATHNSYWVKRDNVVEAFASGAQERLLDQLLFEHVRALEIDIHRDDTHPHDWTIYHTDKQSNSLCTPLSECLKQLEQFHYANPAHEVVTVVLELKELIKYNFDGTHTPQDLDRILETYVGKNLFRPRDFLARCAPGTTMRECARGAGWPTIQELRGKFIFTVLGNWRACAPWPIGHGPSGWATYATWPGDRAAFPMQSDFSDFSHDGCSSEYIPPDQLRAAEDASVFLQVENVTDPAHLKSVAQFLSEGGVVRGHDSWTVADQTARVTAGFQMFQTDYPWVQANDQGPAQPFRPFHPEDFAGSEQFLEPGNRIAFSRSSTQGSGHAFAYLIDPDETWNWETLPATTRPSPEAKLPNPRWTRGKGCLRAASDPPDVGDNETDSFSICRQTVEGRWNVSKPLGEDIAITVEIRRSGRSSFKQFFSDANTSRGAGDMIRLAGYEDNQGNTCVTGYSSSELNSAGLPLWRPLATQCFATTLPYQGVTAQWGDVLFVGTRHDSAYVAGRSLAGAYSLDAQTSALSTRTGYLVEDLSVNQGNYL